MDGTHPGAGALRRALRVLRRLADVDGVVDTRIATLAAGRRTASTREWCAALAGLHRIGAISVLGDELPEPGTVTRRDAGRPVRLGLRRPIDVSAALALALRHAALAKPGAVQAYARARACRRGVLLQNFGESHPDRCGSCDRCVAG